MFFPLALLAISNVLLTCVRLKAMKMGTDFIPSTSLCIDSLPEFIYFCTLSSDFKQLFVLSHTYSKVVCCGVTCSKESYSFITTADPETCVLHTHTHNMLLKITHGAMLVPVLFFLIAVQCSHCRTINILNPIFIQWIFSFPVFLTGNTEMNILQLLYLLIFYR